MNIYPVGDVLNIKDGFRRRADKKEIIYDDVQILDEEWLSARFMTPSTELKEVYSQNRFWSSSQWKFTDTSLGGNLGLNPKPQWIGYCDIKAGNRHVTNELSVNDTSGNNGMGRYYSEAIDDNAQLIFMTFGVPKFNSLFNFFTRAIDYEDQYIANTGRLPIGYKIGKTAGNLVMLAAFPGITLTIWGVKLLSKLIIGNKTFDYYYMEPTMHTYWGVVNNLVTNMAVEMGVLAPQLMPDGSEANKIGVPVRIDQSDLNEMAEMFPGLINPNTNYIDVFAIATRAQTIANAQLLKEREYYELGEESEFDFLGYVKNRNSVKESRSPGAGFIPGLNKALSFNKTYDDFLNNVRDLYVHEDESDRIEMERYEELKANGGTEEEIQFKKEADGSYNIDLSHKSDYLDRFTKAIDASVKEGGLHLGLYVDYVGSVSESFSNSVGEISTGDTVKSAAGAARNLKFDLAGGNVAGGIDQMISAAKNVLAGALDSVTYGLSSVISTITGGGYIDLPKKWESSSMDLPTISYSTTLISPYGNTISQLQNIYIPLAAILAGTLPLAAGKSSHTSPFLCSLFNKGMQTIDLGMITSLSITRGTSNLGFNKQKRPLAIEVTFTVTDFSTLITAPVSSSMFDVFNVAISDDTPLGRYIATLGSRDLLTHKYTLPKIKLKASRALMKANQYISPASFGLRVGNSLSGILGGVVADHSLTLSHANTRL